MTPIAREFSQQQRKQAAADYMCMYDEYPSPSVERINGELYEKLNIDLVCTVNHLTAQVEEARRLLDQLSKSKEFCLYISPDSGFGVRVVNWLSANPVRTEIDSTKERL